MSQSLPMFPLNTVLFPGMSVPLHVFEDRYRALVHELMRIDDPAQRLFGSVAIREGFEVGDADHRTGRQSLHRIGCVLQLTDVTAHPDGSFDIVALGRGRLRMEEFDASGPYPAAQVALLDDELETVPPDTAAQAVAVFARYRARISEISGHPVFAGDLPQDPTYLSWSLAATSLLTLADRQSLLEADDAGERLAMVTWLLRQELRAMAAMPSLPALDISRSSWSPN